MKKTTLLKYLKEENVLDEELYDCLAFDLNKHFYFFGNHFNRSLEKIKEEEKTEHIKNKLRAINASSYITQSIKNFDPSKPLIISNAYFTVDDELFRLGFNIISPPWISTSKNNRLYDKALLKLAFKIRGQLELADFNYLVSADFISLIKEFRKTFKAFLSANKITALVVSNDEGFFENITIKICKELNIPTFIFLHGLPAVYNGKDGNRSDYLVVWGQKIKELFIKSGIEANKIFISGHPFYKNFTNKDLKFSFDNILVLSKAMNWSQHIDEIILKDRAQIILYLLKIEKVLKKLSIHRVHFRPHPSENINWYLSFLNRDFFIPDTGSLQTSLNNSSLVIGPTSSVFLESIYRCVNYTVFEPIIDEKDILDNEIFPPFDNSDKRVPVALNEEDLLHILQNKIKVNVNVLNDYLSTPFDIHFIKHLIMQHAK